MGLPAFNLVAALSQFRFPFSMTPHWQKWISPVRKQRTTDVALQLAFSVLVSPSRTSAHGAVLPMFRVDLPTSTNSVWKLPHRHAQVCLLSDSRACQVDNLDHQPSQEPMEKLFFILSANDQSIWISSWRFGQEFLQALETFRLYWCLGAHLASRLLSFTANCEVTAPIQYFYVGWPWGPVSSPRCVQIMLGECCPLRGTWCPASLSMLFLSSFSEGSKCPNLNWVSRDSIWLPHLFLCS